ncbi:MAG: hypothetical protein JNL87_09270 [Burkholderiaceae bacterium]|nr:hypothetical protein [Burkholderiaceae bacterium]
MRVYMITGADLVDYHHLLPQTARELVRVAGATAALALLNTLPGVVMLMPKGPDNNARGARRWARLVEVAGPEAVAALAAHCGGGVLEIPTCAQLRTEIRRAWLRKRFDVLTARPPAGCGLSRTQAVQELGVELAIAGYAMSSRGIETAIDGSGPESARDARPASRQQDLFAL